MVRFFQARCARLFALAVWVPLLLAFSAGGAGAQKTIHVPQDQPSIQAGLDAAKNGDTVLVSPGSYTELLNFKGKAVTLTTGANGYDAPEVAATTISPTTNAQNFTNPIVNFFSGEGRGTVLNGFTFVSPAQPFLSEYPTPPQNCGCVEAAVLNSRTPPFAGPYNPGTPTITNNRFVGDATPIALIGGVIAGNYFGGGSGNYVIRVGRTSVPGQGNSAESDIHDNVMENNSVNSFVENKTVVSGILFANDARVYNNTVRNNTVQTLVAGVSHQAFAAVGFQLAEPLVFAQNLVYGNQMDVQFSITIGTDPGITSILTNNTIADNRASPLCTQMCSPSQLLFIKSGAYDGNHVLLANNIMQAEPGAGPTIACTDDPGGPYLPSTHDTLQVDHNLFAPSPQPVFDGSCRQQIVNAGNLSADPGFAAPANGNYRLTRSSAAVDAGNNSLLAQLSTFFDPALAYSLITDLEGQPRPADATGRGYQIIDMGAYELSGTQSDPPTGLLLIPSSYQPVTTTQATLTAYLSSALGVPTGTVTLTDDGNVRGTASVQADGTAVFSVTQLTNGIHEFIATYPGNRTFPPAVSPKLVLPFEPILTSLQLQAGPTLADFGAPVTLYVESAASDGTIPSPVILTDNGQALGTLYPDHYGNASLVVTTFMPGTHTIVASYAGTATYTAASATATVTIQSSGFTIALNPPTITVASGQQGRTTVVLTSSGKFSGLLNLAAGAMPQYVSATFLPRSVSLNAGATASAVLTMATAGGSDETASGWREGGSIAPFTCVALLLLPLGRKRRRWQSGLLALVAGVMLIAVSGCTTVRSPEMMPYAPRSSCC